MGLRRAIQGWDVDPNDPWPRGGIEKKTKRCPSDLTDEEWLAIEPMLRRPGRRGRKRTANLREAVNAIRYMVRSGCDWRMFPIHFPPWQTVYCKRSGDAVQAVG